MLYSHLLLKKSNFQERLKTSSDMMFGICYDLDEYDGGGFGLGHY